MLLNGTLQFLFCSVMSVMPASPDVLSLGPHLRSSPFFPGPCWSVDKFCMTPVSGVPRYHCWVLKGCTPLFLASVCCAFTMWWCASLLYLALCSWRAGVCLVDLQVPHTERADFQVSLKDINEGVNDQMTPVKRGLRHLHIHMWPAFYVKVISFRCTLKVSLLMIWEKLLIKLFHKSSSAGFYSCFFVWMFDVHKILESFTSICFLSCLIFFHFVTCNAICTFTQLALQSQETRMIDWKFL